MRNTLALIAGGASAGVALGVLRLFASDGNSPGFSSGELRFLPWVFGVFVWFSIKNGGQKKSDQEGAGDK